MQARYLFLVLCILAAMPLLAQPSPRAQKFFRKGQYCKAKRDTANAYRYLKKAIAEELAYEEAYSTLGKWYYDAKLYHQAGDIFAQAARYCPKGKSNFSLPAGRSYLMAQKPDTALQWLAGASDANKEVQKLKKQAALIMDMQTRQDTTQVVNLGIRINSNYPELFPSLSADRNTLYLTRRVNGRNEDFFLSHPDSCGGWLTARNMGYPPNTAAQESAHTVSADDHYLFFMRSDNRSENGWGRGGCDLYLAYRVSPDSAWSVPESFGATINTPAFEGMPSLSPDITDLYFASDRPGGYGGMDIWVSHFSFGLWQLPKNLGPEINTPGNETAPFICTDNKTLFFASDAHPGLGGSDLFMSRKIQDTLWTTPKNLGFPINSTFDENSMYVSPDGTETYFASDRNKVAGDLDIYQATLPGSFAPEPTVFVLCYIYDSITKDVASYGSITLYDSLGNELAMYHSNRGDGSVLMSLPLNTIFNYEIKAFSYQAVQGSLFFTEACTPSCIRNMALLPQGYVRPTTDTPVLTIFFPRNITELSENQVQQLQEAIAPWKDMPDITVFVNSYTDNSGTPMINMQKSTIRANSILEALQATGVFIEHIQATGFGEENPLVPNDSPENQDKNRRAEVVIRY